MAKETSDLLGGRSELHHVLVVEDNPAHAEALASALGDASPAPTLHFARSAAELFAVLEARRVDIVVLDDTLPDGEPTLVLTEIQLRAQPPPVVVVASKGDERLAVDVVKLGAADYLVKTPENLGRLAVSLSRALDHARLKERVRVSERQYRDLIEASNDAIYILVENSFNYVNRRFSELFGWSAEELTDPAFDYFCLIADEWRPLVAERGRRMRAGQPLPSRYEFEGVRRDGSRFDVEVSVSYIDYDGHPAVLGILTDITARKAYEKALLRKNRELSVLNALAEATTRARDLAQILDGVVERVIELLEVDAAGIAIFEPDRPQFASIQYRGVSETFVRETRARGVDAGLFASVREGQRLTVVPDVAREPLLSDGPAGREGFRSAVFVPLVSHDRCSGIFTIYAKSRRSFSEEEMHLFTAIGRQLAVAIENARLYRKAQEGITRLRALSEITRAIGSTLEVEGVFRIVGERLQQIVPYRHATLNILRRDGSGFSKRVIDRPAAGEMVSVRLMEPIKAEPAAMPVRVLERRQLEVVGEGGALSAYVPIIADNAPLGVFVVSTDEAQGFRERDLDLLRDLAAHMAISLKNARVFQDLERAYRDLRDAKDRLVRSEKLQSLGELAAGVAHDFNNMLSAILGRAQMLKVQLKDPETLKSVRVIEKAALDGAGTVRRIQEFAKERSEGDYVPIHVNTLVRDAVDLTTTRVNELGIDIDVQVQLGEAGVTLGNPSELREVLTNLILNGIDAMPHGGRLAIRTGKDAAHDRVWFEVEDSGIGMDEETQRRIFDPFFTTKGTRGTGLGLSVSYGIVQRHKGEFTVRSSRGAGSTIRVSFPADDGASGFSGKDGLTPYPREMLAAEEGREQARILVIDDDNAVREVLADILRTGAHHVVSAASGPEGIELFQQSPFDVVFTDLGMPGMNGWEVAHKIKSLSPTTPVGLITGWGSSLDEGKVKDRGVDLVVSKPFRYNQVLDLVAEAMDLKGRDT